MDEYLSGADVAELCEDGSIEVDAPNPLHEVTRQLWSDLAASPFEHGTHVARSRGLRQLAVVVGRQDLVDHFDRRPRLDTTEALTPWTEELWTLLAE